MKDPAFLFYPGDYLQDTQCLSENSQVAYDRIMCAHMKNMCVDKKQFIFFTKRLTDGEREELLLILKEKDGGYIIPWVYESLSKRRAYSASRRKNREGKKINTSLHMENETENENVTEEGLKAVRLKKVEQDLLDNELRDDLPY